MCIYFGTDQLYRICGKTYELLILRKLIRVLSCFGGTVHVVLWPNSISINVDSQNENQAS